MRLRATLWISGSHLRCRKVEVNSGSPACGYVLGDPVSRASVIAIYLMNLDVSARDRKILRLEKAVQRLLRPAISHHGKRRRCISRQASASNGVVSDPRLAIIDDFVDIPVTKRWPV